MSQVIKAKFGNDLRRLNGNFGGEVSKLQGTLCHLYGISAAHTFKIRYIDEDGDHITITSNVEFQEALEASKGVLRLELELVDQVQDNEPMASQTIEPEEPQQQEPEEPQQQEPEEPQQQEPEEPQQQEEEPQEQPQEPETRAGESSDQKPFENAEQYFEAQSEFPHGNVTEESVPQYDNSEYPGNFPTEKQNSSNQNTSSHDVPELDYLTNEFHYHRLLVETAVQASFENLRNQYQERYRPRFRDFVHDFQIHSATILAALEKALDSFNEGTKKSFEDASQKFSSSLKEMGTVTDPILHQLNHSFRSVLVRFFEKDHSSKLLSAPEVMKEMQTFSSSEIPSPVILPEGTETPVAPKEEIEMPEAVKEETEVPVATEPVPEKPDSEAEKELAVQDFVYVVDDSFPFLEQFQLIQSMGFEQEEVIKSTLLAKNGDLNATLDALMYAE